VSSPAAALTARCNSHPVAQSFARHESHPDNCSNGAAEGGTDHNRTEYYGNPPTDGGPRLRKSRPELKRPIAKFCRCQETGTNQRSASYRKRAAQHFNQRDQAEAGKCAREHWTSLLQQADSQAYCRKPCAESPGREAEISYGQNARNGGSDAGRDRGDDQTCRRREVLLNRCNSMSGIWRDSLGLQGETGKPIWRY
jgi:hypothetical protein